MKLTDKRIIDFLEKRLSENGLDREKFLEPKISDLRDAHLMKNMDAAAEKIKEAVLQHKKILIFGDYDSDGICSSTMLYLYLKKIGANVDVYVPNRFDNGYGISVEAIDEIEFEYEPDLVVTVDLGITAIEEVEILKQEGIDVVITDHHIPLSELPDTIVVDPKIDPDKTYGFESLCGAGVALKLIEALSDRETALEYLDLCAIATIGDIVPLVDENRVIAKFGIEKINSGKCLPSIKYMLSRLDLEQITSTDVSFKIVPRLNACGRMDNAIKVFRFLIEASEAELAKKYAEIESDNTLRLAAIDSGSKEIAKKLLGIDTSEPSILIEGDFHEWIVGILASHVAKQFNKPAIIFTTDEEGNLKGSGRSTPEIDIHKIISEMSDMLINFGGHKMACGLEIAPENFETFKTTFNEKLAIAAAKSGAESEPKPPYDILLTDDDLTDNFYRQIELLEPFGCENEKPIFAIKFGKLVANIVNERSFKHYRIFTPKNNVIMAFNGYKYLGLLRDSSEKLLTVELSYNIFRGKKSLNTILKKLELLTPKFDENDSQNTLSALYNKYYSLLDFNDPKKYHETDDVIGTIKQKFAESGQGTVVVASSASDLEMLNNSGISLDGYFCAELPSSRANCIICGGRGVYSKSVLSGYKNIIFLHSHFASEHLHFSSLLDTYENKTNILRPATLSVGRDLFAKTYKSICQHLGLKANDELDYAERLAAITHEYSSEQVLFCMLVFMELNFIEFDPELSMVKLLKSKKVELSASKLYTEVKEWIQL